MSAIGVKPPLLFGYPTKLSCRVCLENKLSNIVSTLGQWALRYRRFPCSYRQLNLTKFCCDMMFSEIAPESLADFKVIIVKMDQIHLERKHRVILVR